MRIQQKVVYLYSKGIQINYPNQIITLNNQQILHTQQQKQVILTHKKMPIKQQNNESYK